MAKHVHAGAGAASAHDEGHDHTHHIIPPRTYYIVFGWLMILLIITLAAAAFDLGAANLPIAMAIAVAKAALVFLYFMHLKYSSNLQRTFAWCAIFWLVIMFLLTFVDYMSRHTLSPLVP